MSRSKRKQVRRVHIDGLEWQYQVGHGSVSIRDPDGNRTVVSRTANMFDEHPTPQVVKDFIWKKLHPVRKLTTPVGTADAKDMLINLFCGSRKEAPTYYDHNGRRKFAGAQK